MMPPSLLDWLARRLPPSPLTRFAPSPTGYLHLGHAANAVWVWGVARALGGRVLLRLEDHDRTRCRPEYERALLEDLEWLGLTPDLPGAGSGNPGPLRQSERGALYAERLSHLARSHHVYPCGCSRRDLVRVGGTRPNEETRYPGRCRERGLEPGPGRGLRVALDPGAERFEDAISGEQLQEPSRQCGDLLVRDRLGQWTYQFAVTVDDASQEIDLVVRGQDLLDSTGRQIRLARMLGRASPPVYLHHPLIRKDGGAKLSKASRDTGLRELRAAGISAETVLGEAAHRTGLLECPRALAAADLAGLFHGR